MTATGRLVGWALFFVVAMLMLMAIMGQRPHSTRPGDNRPPAGPVDNRPPGTQLPKEKTTP